MCEQAEALAVLEQVGQLYIKDHEKEVDEAHRYLPEEARGLVWQQQTPPPGLPAGPEGGDNSSGGPPSAAAAEQRGGGFAYGALPPQVTAAGAVVGDDGRPVACLLPGGGGGGSSPPWRLPPLLMPGPCKSRPSLGARLVVQVKGLFAQ